MRSIVHALVVAALLCAGSGDAWAAGGYSSKKQRKPSPLARVETALDDERYDDALVLLEPIVREDPDNADAWNLTGYANRKLGRTAEARQAYDRALELDPKHKRAHEYLGELFLQTDDLASAEAQLAILDDLCLFPCREERKLRKAIKAYRSEREAAASGVR